MAEEIRAEMVANVWKVVKRRRRHGRRGRHAGDPRVDEDGDPGRRRVRRHVVAARRQRGRRRAGGRPDRGRSIDRHSAGPAAAVPAGRAFDGGRPADRRRVRGRRPARGRDTATRECWPTWPTRAAHGEVLVAVDDDRRGARRGDRSCCPGSRTPSCPARARRSSGCSRSTRPRRAGASVRRWSGRASTRAAELGCTAVVICVAGLRRMRRTGSTSGSASSGCRSRTGRRCPAWTCSACGWTSGQS